MNESADVLPRWVCIQIQTFTNWLNHELRNTDVYVNDLKFDLNNGIALIRLVEQLQKRSCTGRIYLHDPTEIQCLMNTQMALEALEEDGIKLINIGSQDIVTGNLKLILGLTWSIIQRYQIARCTKVPPKKLIMAWLQAVIPPQLRINNFSSSWNDGIALIALINYCRPGILPHWNTYDRSQSLANCQIALETAHSELDVPMIISAEHLNSLHLDQNSCLAYISYFTKELGPGYYATLAHVQNLIPDIRIRDFGSSWNDGFLLCRLVTAVSGRIVPFENDEMVFDDPTHWIWNIRQALDAAVDLGVKSLVEANEIADPNNDDHIGLMALCASLCSLMPSKPKGSDGLESREPAVVHTTCLQNQQLNLDLAFAKHAELDVDDLTVLIVGPNGRIPAHKIPIAKQKTENGAIISFTPQLIGSYRVHILCEEVELPTSPIALEVLPTSSEKPTAEAMSEYFDTANIGNVTFTGLSDPCSIGSVVEVVINAQGGPARKEVSVLSVSPSGALNRCEIIHQDNYFTAVFKPEEVGTYKIQIEYDHEPIRGSPFICQVFDADRVSVYGLDVGLVNQELKFTVDASRAGVGTVKVSVFRDEQPIPCSVVEEGGRNRYKVQFSPQGPGKNYRINITFNGMEIKGSPYFLDIADASSVSVHGDQLKAAAVGRTARFYVQTSGAELKDVNVVITDANDSQRHARVLPIDGENGRFQVEWKPQNVGEHLIDVLVYNQSVNDPIVCNVGDPQKVSVTRIPNFIDVEALNKELSFEVDAEISGVGELQLLINSGRVHCEVQELSKRRYLAKFVPSEAIPHKIEMKFNGFPVKGSPWLVPLRGMNVYSSSKSQVTSSLPQSSGDQFTELVGLGLHRAQVGEISFFDITTSTGHLKPADVEVRLEDDSGKLVETRVIPLRTALRCEYKIAKVGDHRLEIRINGRLIDSGPLTVAGYDINKVRVQPVRTHGVGNPAQFVVATTEAAGQGELEITINQGKVPNKVELQDPGRCLVTFIPQHVGTYVIDVTFNGVKVEGCPIRVDINEKSIGKQVSAPVVHPHRFTGSAVGVAGGTSPRPPSSAYFSASSPQVDTSPTSPVYQQRESPRSPSLVAAHTRDKSSDEERTRSTLRSPRLVHGANLGYTVAHYGEGTEYQKSPPSHPPSDAPRRYFGDPTDLRDTASHARTDYRAGESTVDSGLGSYSATSPRPHRYFESDTRSSSREPEWRRSVHESNVPPSHAPPAPPQEDTQFEMTRSAEVRLYRDGEGNAHPTAVKTQALTSHTGPTTGGVSESGYDYRVTSDSSAIRPSRDQHRRIEQSSQFSPAPIGDVEPRPDYAEPPIEFSSLNRTNEFKSVPLDNAIDQRPIEEEISKHKRQPSGAGSMTPGTRRKLMEHSVQRSADLKESSYEYQSESDTGASRSSKPTTPRLSLKFGSRDRGNRSADRGFEFGKSKFSSKHEVVRLGKDVEVKLESLKLGKEDQLRVVVTPPSRGRATDESAALSVPDLPHRLKKSGKTYEIIFKPSEVGTHKVLAFVNDQPHPASPFPIRVYDTSRIIVGEIPSQSVVNDTVEFTADATASGFGVLEIAIKDADGVIIPSHVNQLESGTAKFLVTFNPTTTGTHSVQISFNKEQIAGSPFRCEIVEAAQMAGGYDATTPTGTRKKDKAREKERKREAKKDRNGLPSKPVVSKIPSLMRVGKPATVQIQLPNSTDGVQATIVDSAKQNCPAKIFEEDANTRRIEFVPEMVGDYVITLLVNETEVAGSPFTCRAYDPSSIIVGQIPDGVVNTPVHFIVDAYAAGIGNLEVSVNDGKIPSMAHALGQHKYDISFVPREPIDHYVSIRFNNEPVNGSPFLCRLLGTQQMRVRASGPGLDRVAVGRIVNFAILVDDSRGTNASLPKVTISDPKGTSVPVTVYKDDSENDSNSARFIAEYSPNSVGNYQVQVIYEGQPISGSPFSVKAFDASCVRLSLGEAAIVGQPCTFTVSASDAGAGSLELIVSVQDRNVPNFVEAEGQAKFKVSFTPQEARDHVISVKFNNEQVPGSPMVCPVLSSGQQVPPLPTSPPPADNDELRLVGDLAVAQVGRPKGFSIDAPHPNVDCNVIVTGPGKRNVPVELIRVGEGDHHIDIQVNGRSLAICPIVCHVLSDSSTVPETVRCGEPIDFDLLLGRVAPNEEIRVEVRSGDGKSFPCSFDVDKKKGRVRVGCTVSKQGRYSVILYRNGSIAEEHFFVAESSDSIGVVFLSFPERALIDRSSRFELELSDGLEDKLMIDVTDSDGNSVPVSLHRTAGRTFAVDWTPKTAGTHTVDVRLTGEAKTEPPRQIRVLDLSAVQLVGLVNAPVGVQQRFNLEWGQSGGGNTTVKVTHGDNKSVACQMRRLKHGVDACSFVPSVPGLYLIDVAIDGVTLPECPYECMIRDSGAVRAVGDALNSAQCGRTARFEVVVGNTNHDDLDVTITDPHRSPLPVRCYRQQDNTYWVEFTPEVVGAHLIEIALTDRSNHADTPIPGSPFHCEVVDPRRVAIRGLDDRLVLRHIANVTINRRNAGNGQLNFEISDPSGAPLKVDRLKNSVDDDSFTFLPNRLGPHSIRVQLAGFPVPGLPKTIDVEEAGRITLQGPALESPVKVGETAALLLDTRKAGGLKIDVRSPHGEKLQHSTNKRPDNTTEITFHPNDVGTHLVSVDYNNKKLVGSPYSVHVVDPRKVLVDDENTRDDGALLLATGERNAVDIDATAAGSGQLLRAEVRDPRGELLKENEARIESPGRGKFRLLITPKRTGTHKIYLTFADHPVPSAHPLIAHVEQGRASPHGRVSTPKETRQEVRHTYTSSHSHSTSFDSQTTEQHARVKAYGDGINRAIVKEPTEFFIDATHAAPNATARKTPPNPLKVEATLIGDKADVPVRLVSAGPYLYKGTYTALIGGSYDLHVLVDDKPIRDSPFRVNVQAFKTPAESIEVDFRTLKMGILGEDVKTIINTKNATPGHLSAQCEGPSRLEYCELYDNRDGTYILRVTPKELGKHVLTIRYADEHVPGSPFVFSVCNPPDASKVRVYGPGIEHGILAKFESNFVVETRGAGAGQLTVRVRGPKGAFNVEMQRDRQQDRTIHCKYEPREPGDYQVEVKWHNEHVPGSPFLVLIVDTEEELQRFLSGGIPSPPPLVPFAPPGWVPQMPMPGVAPPLMGPPLAPSIYGPIPVGMMPPAHAKGRRSAPPQVVYGRAQRRH